MLREVYYMLCVFNALEIRVKDAMAGQVCGFAIGDLAIGISDATRRDLMTRWH